MGFIVVDVEGDGPCPTIGSMVCFGAVSVDDMSQTFYGQTKPICDIYNPEALAISGFSREEHMQFDAPSAVMKKFEKWVKEVGDGYPTLISDNPAYDWQWINYYFHLCCGHHPFGFSARRIGDLYCGMVKNARKNKEWKRKFRKTKHTHNPVDDAMGNAEAIIAMKKLGLTI